MSPVIWLCWGILAIGCMLPVIWCWRLVVHYWRYSHPPRADSTYHPTTAVILPVRGADPSLPRCVRSLLRQNYPNYSVHIIVDHESDPAWDVVHGVIAEEGDRLVDVHVSVLRDRLETCSLKVSSQLQVLTELDDDVEVVAFLDADSIPAGDWLASLVGPLADPAVGTTMGIRWFAPADASWGSLVRHMFNAGSQPQMFIFRIPWGGSMAMRRETINRGKLPDHWAGCFCEDTSSYGPLYDLGLRVEVVPAATQFNEESLELAGAARFIFRQLLCVRLHTAKWKSLLRQNLANAAALAIAAVVAVGGVWFQAWDVTLAFGGLVGFYILAMAGAHLSGEWLMRSNMRSRLDCVPAYPPLWKLMPAAVIAQSISMHFLWACVRARQVEWRGVTYALSPGQVRLVEYRPYESGKRQRELTRSVV